MAYERLIRRILYISQCPKCGDRQEVDANPPRERFCSVCEIWVPFVEESYTGPDLQKK